MSAAKSVAVLPFTNMSADPENEYFTDGMAEEIINALTKVQSLRVASRTSSFAFKGKNEDIGEIGKKLKVSTVLEGSVRKMGNELRITAQLVNVADGSNLWSERYDREMEDVFAIQDDISQAIVKALKVILTEGEKKQIEKARTENVAGVRLLSARTAVLSHPPQEPRVRAADVQPRRSRPIRTMRVPMPALPILLAALHVLRRARIQSRQADTASAKALELEPDLAEAHVARGLAVSLSKRFRGSRDGVRDRDEARSQTVRGRVTGTAEPSCQKDDSRRR